MQTQFSAANFIQPAPAKRTSDVTTETATDISSNFATVLANDLATERTTTGGITLLKDPGECFQPRPRTAQIVRSLLPSNSTAAPDKHLSYKHPSYKHPSYKRRNNEARWISCICPTEVPLVFWSHCGMQTNASRLIHVRDTADLLWVIWEALAAGNSHSLVAYVPTVSQTELVALNQAAALGSTQLILITQHTHADLVLVEMH